MKGTAVKRLLDAVNGGNVEVPAHIRRLELDLKKEWEGNERRAKKELADAEKKAKGKGAGAGAGKKTNKRKADADADSPSTMTTNVGGMSFNFNFNFAGGSPMASVTPDNNTAASNNNKPAAKRAKTGEPKVTQSRQTAKSQPKAAEPKPKPEPKVKREPARQTAKSQAKAAESKVKPEPEVNREPKVKREQTVKREPPTPKKEEESWVKSESPPPFRASPPPSSSRAPSLGLLNGVYEIDAYDLEDFGDYQNNGCRIILCLDRKTLWGEFDFCGLHGVMFFPERPWASSPNARIGFTYRGYDEVEDINLTDDSRSEGWVTFLGNGQIEGCFEAMTMDSFSGDMFEVRFRGFRISGQQTRPPRDAYSMQDEWNWRNEHD